MTTNREQTSAPRLSTGSVGEVFIAFLKLGLTSFGGPIAHLAYFHRELIERRKWLDEAQYAQLVALCQFLPGPASSQLGFAMGLIRAGWLGALAAFLAFTVPSVLLLIAFAQLLPLLDHSLGQAAIQGLKLLAVAVVAHGLLTMIRKLTPDWPRRMIAIATTAALIFSGSASAQLIVIAAGAVMGILICPHAETPTASTFALRYSHRTAFVLLSLFAILLTIALIPGALSPLATVAAAFYRAGALVFGGGHVVLPLLQEAVVEPGLVSANEFLAGYGAAQAVPGPMFSIAVFLGARIDGALGAVVSTVAIFAPGFLLVAAALPLWHSVTRHPHAARAMAGVNAAVVGLLAAALYDPVWTRSVLGVSDFVIAAISFGLLISARVPLLAVLAWSVLAAMLSATVL